MRELLRAAALAALAALAACTGPSRPVAGQTIDESFVVNGFTWDSGTIVYILLKTFQSGDKVGLCGAWTVRSDTATITHFNDQAIAAASVDLDGTTLKRGLEFMSRHAGAKTLAGRTANCIETGTEWRDGFDDAEPRLVVPRMRFVI